MRNAKERDPFWCNKQIHSQLTTCRWKRTSEWLCVPLVRTPSTLCVERRSYAECGTYTEQQTNSNLQCYSSLTLFQHLIHSSIDQLAFTIAQVTHIHAHRDYFTDRLYRNWRTKEIVAEENNNSTKQNGQLNTRQNQIGIRNATLKHAYTQIWFFSPTVFRCRLLPSSFSVGCLLALAPRNVLLLCKMLSSVDRRLRLEKEVSDRKPCDFVHFAFF